MPCWSSCRSKALVTEKTCTTAARDISWRWYIPRGGKERICRVQKQEKEPVVPAPSERSQQRKTGKPTPTGRPATPRDLTPAQESRSSAVSPVLPALGAVRLEALNAPMIQAFYNAMGEPSQQNPKGLSAKTVKNVHGVLHKALQQAVLIGHLRVQTHCGGYRLPQRPFPRFASLLRSCRDPRRRRHQDSAG